MQRQSVDSRRHKRKTASALCCEAAQPRAKAMGAQEEPAPAA
jgi:hypothetical protein